MSAYHLLRAVRETGTVAVMKMNTFFSGMYEADIKGSRPDIETEMLLRAMPLQVFYSVRSERQLMDQSKYNLLFR